MPVQSYTQFIKGAYAGQQAGLAQSSSVITSRKTLAVVKAGAAVKFSGEDVTNGSVAGLVGGIVFRQNAHEAATRPAHEVDAISYDIGTVVAIAEEGKIIVAYTTAITGDRIYVHPTNGTFSGTAVGGHVAATNVVVDRVLPDNLAEVFISKAPIFAAP